MTYRREKPRGPLQEALEILNKTQFNKLVSDLPPERQDQLTKPVSKASFLADMARWRKLHDLEEFLREEWPELLSEPLEQLKQLRSSAPPPVEKPEHLQTSARERTSVNFVNRVAEINSIFQSTLLAQYWIIDAPIGYGKTKLLKEIRERYTDQGWLCCYVGISRDAPPRIRALANELLVELGGPELQEQVEARRMGFLMAASILGLPVDADTETCLSEAQYTGIAILVDNVEALADDTLSELAELTTGLFDGLRNGGFFAKQNRLRLFLAGRDARRKSPVLQGGGISSLVEQSLSPYRFSVVEETVRQYALKSGMVLPEDNLPQIAAHLMHLTGGHPGCMAAILEELAAHRFVEAPLILEEQPEGFLRDIVFPVVEEIQGSFKQLQDEGLEPSNVLSTLETLSVFRRYGPWLLRALLDRELIQLDTECDEDEEYALEGMLLETYLLERKGGFLQNDISRRLFAIHLRSTKPERFQELCQVGLALYQDYLHSQNLRRPEIVAVEWIYQEVQYEYYVEEKQGSALLEHVLEKTRSALEILMATWDSREIVPDFIAVLLEDWELRFMVNYFSSEDVYSYRPYRELTSSVRDLSIDVLGG